MGFAPKIRFAPDSPLEGSGFEPSVPLPRLSSTRAVRAAANPVLLHPFSRSGFDAAATARSACLARQDRTGSNLRSEAFARALGARPPQRLHEHRELATALSSGSRQKMHARLRSMTPCGRGSRCIKARPRKKAKEHGVRGWPVLLSRPNPRADRRKTRGSEPVVPLGTGESAEENRFEWGHLPSLLTEHGSARGRRPVTGGAMAR